MKSLLAFIKKETMEQFRSGRLMILGILFVLLGVMNPHLHQGISIGHVGSVFNQRA